MTLFLNPEITTRNKNIGGKIGGKYVIKESGFIRLDMCVKEAKNKQYKET